MILISQVKIKMDRLKNKNKSGAMNQEEIQEVSKEVQRFLRVNDSDISSIKVIKKSIDARRGRDISYTFTVDVDLEKGLQDTERIKRLIDKNANKVKIITDHQDVFDPIVLGPKERSEEHTSEHQSN